MPTTYYVDGKTGDDGNAGTTPSAPFATIGHALTTLPQGSAGQAAGYGVSIQGYTDYAYRERAVPEGVVLSGLPGNALTIQATGFGPSTLARLACVDGSALVTLATYAGLSWQLVSGTVWKTAWPNNRTRNDSKIDYTDSERADRIWLNSAQATHISIPLRRPVPAGGAGTALTIADLQGAGFSYFHDRWSDQGAGICTRAPGSVSLPALGTLYVNLAQNATAIGNAAYPAPASTNPAANTLEVPYLSTWYFDNACSEMLLMGLRAWHSDLGFSFKNGCANIGLRYCDGSYNFDMGFAGIGSEAAPVSGLQIMQCRGTGNSIQGCKLDGYTSRVGIYANEFGQNFLQDGVDVVGCNVHDVSISSNRIHDGNLVPLYTRYASNGKILGILLEDACYNVAITNNLIKNQSVAIGSYISGAQTTSRGTGGLSSVHGGDFGATISGNVLQDEVHVSSDSGYAFSWGNPNAGGVDGPADEAGASISAVDNTIVDCDGGGTGADGGVQLTYTPTGKSITGTLTTLSPLAAALAQTAGIPGDGDSPLPAVSLASASDPDAIAAAFVAVWTPGGVPVGGIGAIVTRTPDTPYKGSLPIVSVRPQQNLHGRAMAAGGLTLGKIDRGFVELVYRDAALTQQQARRPGITMAGIEDAMWAARDALVAALDANNTLSGAVTIAGEQIEEMYVPDGNMVEWQFAPWIGWMIRVSYEGTLAS